MLYLLSCTIPIIQSSFTVLQKYTYTILLVCLLHLLEQTSVILLFYCQPCLLTYVATLECGIAPTCSCFTLYTACCVAFNSSALALSLILNRLLVVVGSVEQPLHCLEETTTQLLWSLLVRSSISLWDSQSVCCCLRFTSYMGFHLWPGCGL